MNITNKKFKAACKGIFLPIEVLQDPNLTLDDTAILVLIDSLDSPEKHCTAKNDYIANCFGFTENKISLAISKLERLGYISRLKFDGRTRVLQSNMKQIVAKIDEENKERYKQGSICG